MSITEKDKEIRGIIEKELKGSYFWKAFDAVHELSVCDENYEFIKKLYNDTCHKSTFAHALYGAYLSEKAPELFNMFAGSEEADIRAMAVCIGEDYGIDLTDLFAKIDCKSKTILEDPAGKLSFLAKYTETTRVDVSDDGLSAVIYNPLGKQTMSVYFDIHEYLICYSLQQIYADTPEKTETHIDKIMSDTSLCIGLFKEMRMVTSGGLDASALENLTYESLSGHFTLYGDKELSEIADSFKVMSWSGEKDLDAEFVRTDGKVMIKVVS